MLLAVAAALRLYHASEAIVLGCAEVVDSFLRTASSSCKLCAITQHRDVNSFKLTHVQGSQLHVTVVPTSVGLMLGQRGAAWS